MRIAVTADLHYDIARSRAPARALAEEACREGGDALVLVGDTAAADLRVLLECPKVTHVFRGHSHWPIRRKIGRLTVVNIGSTYTQKRLEVLDL